MTDRERFLATMYYRERDRCPWDSSPGSRGRRMFHQFMLEPYKKLTGFIHDHGVELGGML